MSKDILPDLEFDLSVVTIEELITDIMSNDVLKTIELANRIIVNVDIMQLSANLLPVVMMQVSQYLQSYFSPNTAIDEVKDLLGDLE